MSDECQCGMTPRAIFPSTIRFPGSPHVYEWAYPPIELLPPSVTLDGVRYDLEPALQFATLWDAVLAPDWDRSPYVVINDTVYKGVNPRPCESEDRFAVELDGTRWATNG